MQRICTWYAPYMQIYARNMHEICTQYVENMQIYARNMHLICTLYADICRRYAMNMHKKCTKNAQNMQKYAPDMHLICNKICKKYAGICKNMHRCIFCIFCICMHPPLCWWFKLHKRLYRKILFQCCCWNCFEVLFTIDSYPRQWFWFCQYTWSSNLHLAICRKIAKACLVHSAPICWWLLHPLHILKYWSVSQIRWASDSILRSIKLEITSKWAAEPSPLIPALSL
jgi:hypothetical protein